MHVYFTIAEDVIGWLGSERCLACMEQMQAKGFGFDVTCAWEEKGSEICM